MIISEVRRLRGEYIPDNQIIDKLQIPRRTFYYYVKKMHEQDKSIIADRHNHELELEIQRCKDGLITTIQRLQVIADTAKSDRDKIEALKTIKDIQLDLVRLEHEGPTIAQNYNVIVNQIKDKPSDIEIKQLDTQTEAIV